MIKLFFMALLAIFFPWLALLIEDNPGGALVALIMQATVIGWLPASIWAWRTVRDANKIQFAEKRRIKAAKKAAKKAAREAAQAAEKEALAKSEETKKDIE
ncbi:hypothetical protein Lnau_2058 [Legionella nautarum]|uniref:Proteolipid membrane potential modulator n=1 Tax=Legionella nautarum TaxID=45070 RepID=A0A0W0WP61_9GAMM|nr:YqaE/Pmp3 family membrane protein [Legionella nautarum]KTD34088.1 hypothetical protein Lnau_2058 [Legionella nautarum]